jgi:hypothetical protein
MGPQRILQFKFLGGSALHGSSFFRRMRGVRGEHLKGFRIVLEVRHPFTSFSGVGPL